MNLFTQAIISGLMTGAVYALLAIGLVLTYRTTRLINLAHGETFAIGGVTAAALIGLGVPMYGALLSAVVAATAFMLVLHRFVLRPRAHWPISALILITLGVAFVVRGLLLVWIGPDMVSFSRLFAGPPIRLLGGALPKQGLFLILLGFGLAAAVALFLSLTRKGKELLATAENADASQLLGVNVEAVRLLAYGIAGALGGISAVILVPLISVDFQAGLSMTLRGFIAAAIAGMSPVGAIIAGLGLGLLEGLVTTYIGALSQDPIVFFALICLAVWQSRKIRFGGVRRA
jgi:branched-subunit amino acid ABC-type transport system permease component